MELNAIPVDVPEQMDCVAGVASAVGIGFTVMVTLTGIPGQPASVGVMLYVAVPAAAAEVVRDWLMDDPLPAVAPVTPDCVTVQSKVAPVGAEVRAMPVDAPEQIV